MGMRPKSAEEIVLAEWARQIRAARKAVGLSQVEAAKACGITQSTLSKIENGEYRLHPGMILRLCDGLDLDPRHIFDWPIAIVEIERMRKQAVAIVEGAA